MSLNDTVSAQRAHISFFGMRNAGKSSLVNAVTGQLLAVVSDIKGTTTDPVKKAMEILPLGPVVIIDTPGIDDEGELGELRVQKAKEVLNYTDIAILVVDVTQGLRAADNNLIQLFKEKKIPYIIAYNKNDLGLSAIDSEENEINVSAKEKININKLKEMIAHLVKSGENTKMILSDIVSKDDLAVLVMPIDESAPKGRIILPQQQTLRELLDINASAICCQATELKNTLDMLKIKPKIVITDSQAFASVAKDTPDDILLTSFSILFARYKGNLESFVEGAGMIDKLKDGDKVLISEGCTHHRQCNDIGTVKLPKLLKKYTQKELELSYTSGNEFTEDLTGYSLVIHCGGCMLNEKQMHYRMEHAKDFGVPMTNYGISIAHMNGILKRSLRAFPDILKILD